MIRITRKFVLEIIGLLLAVVILFMLGFGLRLSQGPMKLDYVTSILAVMLEISLAAEEVVLEEPVLAFDRARGGLVFSGKQITIAMANETHFIIDNFSVSASPEAFLDKFILVPHTLKAQNIIAAFPIQNIPPPPGQPVPDGSDGTDRFDPVATLAALQDREIGNISIDYLNYLQQLELLNVALAFYDHKGERVWHSTGSYASFDRQNGKINTLLHLDLYSGDERSILDFTLNQPFALPGEALLRVNNIRPSVLGTFFPNLSVLLLADVPVNGAIAFLTDEQGAFTAGAADFQLSKGTVSIGGTPLTVKAAKALANIDFISNYAVVEALEFDIGPHRGKFRGALDFDMNAQNQLALINGRLSAEEIYLTLSETGDVFNPDNLELGFEIDLIAERLDLTRVEFTTGGGLLHFGSEIAYADPNVPIILSGAVENLPVDGFKKLWPSNIARGAHDWFEKNVQGGLMSVGTLNMQTNVTALRNLKKSVALPRDALNFVVAVENVEINYYKDLPPVRNVEAQITLAGDRLDAYMKRGEVSAPDGSIISITSGRFSAPDFHIRGNDGEIELQLEGRMSAIMQLIDLPSLNLLGRFNLDPGIVDGHANGHLQLSLPLTRRLPKPTYYSRIKVDADAQITDFVLRDHFKNYKIDGEQVNIKVNREQLQVDGEIRLNNVPFKIDWLEHFSKTKSPRTIIALDGMLDETHFAALNLNWPSRHIRGVVPIRVDVLGKLEAFERLTVRADVTQAQMNMSPFAYDKPAGEAASIEFDARFANENQLVALDMALENINVNIKAAFEFDNQLLTALHIAPLQIPNSYDAEIHLTQENGARRLRITGKEFDISRLLKDQNFGEPEILIEDASAPDPVAENRPRPFDMENMLGDNINIEIALDRATANNGIILYDVAGKFVLKNALLEEGTLTAHFMDESSLDFHLFREDRDTRYLFLDVPIAENFFKAIDRVAGMSGGQLLLVGEIKDGAEMTGSGRLYVADFKVRNVPTLAKILSLGSLTGIADTLAGEGIAFRQAEIRYRFNEQLFEIEDMRINGPAIGLTLEGVIDRRNNHAYMDGTIVPAYGINSLLGKIPLIGSLFSGGKGGGLLGLSYNVEGDLADPVVSVNPLSLFTIGFLRNIFKLRLFGPKMPQNVRSFGE